MSRTIRGLEATISVVRERNINGNDKLVDLEVSIIGSYCPGDRATYHEPEVPEEVGISSAQDERGEDVELSEDERAKALNAIAEAHRKFWE
jgi:hypothetical protein